MRVLKFGGTSMGSAEMLERVSGILKEQISGDRVVAVVSAMSGVTDNLEALGRMAKSGTDVSAEIDKVEQRHIQCARTILTDSALLDQTVGFIHEQCNELRNICKGISLTNETTQRIEARILSAGELLSSKILATLLLQQSINARWIDSRDYITTSGPYRGGAVVEAETNDKLASLKTSDAQILVMPGFVARDVDGSVSVLGRGGSDYSAALVAAGVDADVLEIWTDVSGVMTADPRLVPSAVPLSEMTYDEAMEISHFGAKVIYPPTIRPALKKGIPILIKNTFDPASAGTRISHDVGASTAPLRGISHIPDIALLTLSGPGLIGVPGTAMRLFKAMYEGDVNVLFITQSSSEHSITIGIEKRSAQNASSMLAAEFARELASGAVNPVQIEEDLALVAAVGEKMRHRPGIAGALFSLLGENAINIRAIAQGSTERNVSFVVQRNDVIKALNVIHEGFFLSPVRAVHLFVIGVGNVGSEFLQQLTGQRGYLRERYRIDLRVAGIANSRVMTFDEQGVDTDQWGDQDKYETASFVPSAFVEKIHEMNLRNTIFVDNTAAKEIAELYEPLLKHKVHIVTSNKIAASSAFVDYESLRSTAIDNGIQFLFETNVAAGLPVIRTMRDLLLTGDRIHKIQAVLSGTMNFIFNTISDEVSFSKAVAMAREKKFTEPDPAIDLSGLDVRRKALILAREAGNQLELEDVASEEFIDPSLLKSANWDELYNNLKSADAGVNALLHEALDKNCRLRFLAEIDHGKARVGLQAVEESHPAFTLSGSDNLVLLYTDRYREQPMVIRGAGAGPAVTAAGVLADVLRIVNV